MSLLQWFFLIHFGICLFILLLRIVGTLKCEYITVFIAFFIPVWGLGMLILKRASDRDRDREAARLEMERLHAEKEKQSIVMEEEESEIIPLNEALIVNDNATRRRMMMDILYDVNRSINLDPDDMKEMTVPLEEAMIVNDTATRRALLIDVLYSNPADYIAQLFEAKSNDDSEVVHYAATALTEIQKSYDLQFQELAKRRIEAPHDQALKDEYQALLENYISSGLLKGDGLQTQLRRLSGLLEEKLGQEDVPGKWSLLNKKAEADLRLGDVKALEQDVRMLAKEWPERENTYLYRIQSGVLKKDAYAIKQAIDEIREKDRYLSPSLRSIIAFWGGQDAENQATA